MNIYKRKSKRIKQALLQRFILASSRENLSSGFLTRSDTNWTVKSQKVTSGFKFQIYEVEGYYSIYVAQTKVLFSCPVTAKLICVFVFAYAKRIFFTTRLILSLALMLSVTDAHTVMSRTFRTDTSLRKHAHTIDSNISRL